MTSEQFLSECLMFPVLSEYAVRFIFDGRDVERTERQQIGMVCRSHERLRTELAAARKVMDRIPSLEAMVERQNFEIMELRNNIERSKTT